MDRAPDFGLMNGQITESDVLVQGRRRSAAGHPTSRCSIDVHFITIAADATAFHFESNQIARDALLLLLHQRSAADEIALVELRDPCEVRFKRCERGMNLMPVERHFGLETQGVAGAQPSRLDAELLPGGEKLIPNPGSFIGRDVDLETVFTRIAGARDTRLDTADDSIGEMVILDRRERDRRQLLKRVQSARALNSDLRVA